MTPLMSGFDVNHASVSAAAAAAAAGGGNGVGPVDPVELRRINFQTPGMMSHPPIPLQVSVEAGSVATRLKIRKREGGENVKCKFQYSLYFFFFYYITM